MVDILEGMERDEQAMERIASAMEVIAESTVAMYKIMEARLEKEFPLKHEPRESTVTRIPTDEEKLRASQGATGEPLSDWIQLGPREKELVEAESKKKK